jgi:hypothetical protein
VRYDGPAVFDMPRERRAPPPRKPLLGVRRSGDPHCAVCRDGRPCVDHQGFLTDLRRTIG